VPRHGGKNAQWIFFARFKKKFHEFFRAFKIFKIYAKLHSVEKQGIKSLNGKGVYGFSTPYVQF